MRSRSFQTKLAAVAGQLDEITKERELYQSFSADRDAEAEHEEKAAKYMADLNEKLEVLKSNKEAYEFEREKFEKLRRDIETRRRGLETGVEFVSNPDEMLDEDEKELLKTLREQCTLRPSVVVALVRDGPMGHVFTEMKAANDALKQEIEESSEALLRAIEDARHEANEKVQEFCLGLKEELQKRLDGDLNDLRDQTSLEKQKADAELVGQNDQLQLDLQEAQDRITELVQPPSTCSRTTYSPTCLQSS